MNKALAVIATVSLLSGCGLPSEPGSDAPGTRARSDELATVFSDTSRLWPESTGICFRNTRLDGGAPVPGVDYAAARATVLSALGSSWGSVSVLHFTDNSTCPAGVNANQVIQIGLLGDSAGFGTCGYGIGTSCVVGVLAPDRIADVAVHEVGHGLGFGHEHQRMGANGSWEEPLCEFEQNRYNAGVDAGNTVEIVNRSPVAFTKLTQFDPQSIMNYCSTKAPNGAPLTGAALTDLDRLGLEILYPGPAPQPVALSSALFTVMGRSVGRSDLWLSPGWLSRGALPSVFGMDAVQWRVDNLTATWGTTFPALIVPNYGAGAHTVSGSFKDVLGRTQYVAPFGPVDLRLDTSLHTALILAAVAG
jgi:hypothetical protein